MRLEISHGVREAIGAAKALADQGDRAGAARAYRDLLDSLGDDHLHAAAVLHMYAIVVDDPQARLRLNLDSLQRARQAGPELMPLPLRATLMANIGYSYLELGDVTEARRWYVEARDASEGLGDDDYGRAIRSGVSAQLARLGQGPVG